VLGRAGVPNPAQVEARHLERGERAVEVGREDDDVVEPQSAVGVGRRLAGGLSLGDQPRSKSVEICAPGPGQCPSGDTRRLPARETQANGTDSQTVAVAVAVAVAGEAEPLPRRHGAPQLQFGKDDAHVSRSIHVSYACSSGAP
jgi:hypothetical protein